MCILNGLCFGTDNGLFSQKSFLFLGCLISVGGRLIYLPRCRASHWYGVCSPALVNFTSRSHLSDTSYETPAFVWDLQRPPHDNEHWLLLRFDGGHPYWCSNIRVSFEGVVVNRDLFAVTQIVRMSWSMQVSNEPCELRLKSTRDISDQKAK